MTKISNASPYPMLAGDPKRAEKAFRLRDGRLNPLRQAADTLTETLAEVLGDSARFYRFAVKEAEGEITGVDTKVIKELASTVKELAGAMRNLHDIPTDADRQDALIAAGKYRLMEQKAEMGDSGAPELRVLFGEASGEEEGGDGGAFFVTGAAENGKHGNNSIAVGQGEGTQAFAHSVGQNETNNNATAADRGEGTQAFAHSVGLNETVSNSVAVDPLAVALLAE